MALGGGGARGAAHIGVLLELVKNGVNIRGLSGTSIGSVVGGFFACGYQPGEILEIFSKVDQAKLYGWPLSSGPGLLGTKGIEELLRRYFGTKTFDQLSMPFSAVAVDLYSNREIIISSGLVVDAILGSIAVPGLFPPRIIGEYKLIDGGSLDPIPVRAARALFPDLAVVAVSLLSPLDKPSTPIRVISISEGNPIADSLSRLKITQAMKIFADSVDIASRQMAELRLLIDKPEIIIRPDVNGINLLDNVDIKLLSGRGEEAAKPYIGKIKKAASLLSKLIRRFRRIS